MFSAKQSLFVIIERIFDMRNGALAAAQYVKSLALRRGGLLVVERYKLERRRILFGSDESGSDLESVRRSNGVSLHDALGKTANDFYRRDLGPMLPSPENLPPGGEEAPGGGGFLPPPAGERAEEFHARESPNDDLRILTQPTLDLRSRPFRDDQSDKRRGIPNPHQPLPRSRRRSLSTLPRRRGGFLFPSQLGTPPSPRRRSPCRSSRASRAS